MSPHYSVNTLVAVSLVWRYPMFNDQVISILNKNTPAHEHTSFSFDAALIEKILSHIQKNHAEWFQFVKSWKADDEQVERGIRRLRAGLMGRIARTDDEATFETLTKLWTAFVAPGPLVYSLEVAGFRLLEGGPGSEGELVTLPEIEFFDDAGNRVL